MLLKQNDVQMILNQLMGQPLELQPDFEFDELNISAVSEVMNQMMGSCSTALSKFLDMSIDISAPEPRVMDLIDFTAEPRDFDLEEEIVTVTFRLTIEDVVDSEFVSVLKKDLARELSERLMEINAKENEVSTPEPVPVATETVAETSQSAPPLQAAQPQMQQMPQGMPQMGYPQPGMGMPPQMGMPPMGGMPPYGYYPQLGYGGGYMQPSINIQNAQLHQFEQFDTGLSGDQKDNLKLLMGVPLQISVEIGTTRKRVKEILEFSQGTIIELERQAGAPVDVVVNGNLIARGDVVVIDDNFAVRITEIIKSKFMDSLGKE
jgi:flagellar motor switch protein FliN/FliY